MKVVLVLGPKDSGKTSVARLLIECLRSAGLRVVAVKHTHREDHVLEPPETDTGRMWAAGVEAVALISPSAVRIVARRTAGLREVARLLSPLGPDVVVAEGFHLEASSADVIILVGGPGDRGAPERVDLFTTLEEALSDPASLCSRVLSMLEG